MKFPLTFNTRTETPTSRAIARHFHSGWWRFHHIFLLGSEHAYVSLSGKWLCSVWHCGNWMVTTREHPVLWATDLVLQTHSSEAVTSGRHSVLVSPPDYSTIHQYKVWLEFGLQWKENKHSFSGTQAYSADAQGSLKVARSRSEEKKRKKKKRTMMRWSLTDILAGYECFRKRSSFPAYIWIETNVLWRGG